MIKRYKKKPIVIEAIKWWGTNIDEIRKFVPSETLKIVFEYEGGPAQLRIKTLEGEMWVRYGDYIIKGIAGEFYPCASDIFEETYEEETYEEEA